MEISRETSYLKCLKVILVEEIKNIHNIYRTVLNKKSTGGNRARRIQDKGRVTSTYLEGNEEENDSVELRQNNWHET